jgi:hypothetical protein
MDVIALINKSRRFVTTSVAFTFLVVASTGVLFKFFFKTRLLEGVHGWIGIGLVAMACLHVAQNWKSLKRHLRDVRVYLLVAPIVVVVVILWCTKPASTGFNPRQLVPKLMQANAADVSRVFRKDVSTVARAMQADGLHFGNESVTLQELSKINQVSPDRILVYFLR